MNEVTKVASGRVLTGCLVLGVMFCISLCASSARAAIDGDSTTHPQLAARHGGVTALEDRIKTFSKALNLDAAQQTQLRKILIEQLEAVRKIWSDKSLLPAERV